MGSFVPHCAKRRRKRGCSDLGADQSLGDTPGAQKIKKEQIAAKKGKEGKKDDGDPTPEVKGPLC